MPRLPLLLALLLLGAGACLLLACGEDKKPTSAETVPAIGEAAGPVTPNHREHGLDDALTGEIAAASASGRAYLLGQQTDDGGFGDAEIKIPGNVSYTAMAVTALVATTPSTQVSSDADIRRALDFIVKFQQENGSIVDDPRITNYCTSAALSALAAAKIGDYRKAQVAAGAYIKASQISENPKDLSFGGFPYKQHKGQSADASNAMMAANALDADELPQDSEVRKRVGAFVTTLQNHSETNRSQVVIEVDGKKRTVVAGVGGGGFYRPDESKAGMIKRSDGKWELRSYGSMTYAVLKLLLFSGAGAEDSRVKAVVEWISRNWSVERNPGFQNADDAEKAGQQGMYYYLYTATRALAGYEQTSGKPLVVTDADGRRHNWRAEIARALLGRQGSDGSWRNEVAERWEEGSKTLATAFALQTLGHLSGRLK